MCDTNQYQQMTSNCQAYQPCEASYTPQMDSQNEQKLYCPPSCDQCVDFQQPQSPGEFICYESETPCQISYQPQQQMEMNDQCCENVNDNFVCPPQSCEYQSCDPYYCPSNNNQSSPEEPQRDMLDHKVTHCPCPQKCRMPSCSPFSRRRYVQPPRRSSFKPINCYQKPTVPFTCDTIYRKSFEHVEPCCRVPLIRPRVNIKGLNCPMDKETITKLSYQPYCQVERAKPIYPYSPSLLGTGPMQGMTTQKHDFVPKFQYRRLKIYPRDSIKKLCGCVEKTTTQRLSFMAPCVDGRRESFKPFVCYQRPELPMEKETTQKLSYMPVCPAPREELPWAKKPKYLPPSIGFAKDTVTKLSFQPPGCFVDECQDPCLNQYCQQIEC